jgi:D-alanyl-D-alanine-carboxypeptidase/D-alanyl-D-alanine-endopeptidase
MRHGIVLWMLPLTLLSSSIGAQSAGATFPSDSALHDLLRQRVADKRSAGLVVGLLAADGSTRVIADGDPGPGQPPLDANSVFEIGSITKVFTSAVLAEMVQEGKVRLDDPAQRYLPAGVHLPTRNGKVITLAMLSEQNSGLPRMPTNFHPADPANPYADYSVRQLYDFLNGYQLARDPGERFEYSNLGVGLLGHILTLVDGKPYEQMLRDRIWRPLGMTQTAIVLSAAMREHLALGHDEQGAVTANWDLDALAGAGAIRSTATDMLAFAAANVHPERGPLQRALTFAHQERADAGSPMMRIGLNWMSSHVGSDTIVWHNGGTGGYRTFLGFVPSAQRAVVVLTNSTGVGADDIGMHLLVPLLPLAPKPQPMKQRTAIVLPPAMLDRYVGKYQLAPNFVLDVTRGGDGLWLQPTGQGKLELWPESETEFFLKEVDAQVSIVRDPSGAVTGVVLHQNGQNSPAPKIP